MKLDNPTLVYLVRHGETEWNQNHPGYCGWTDIPLNEKGRAQAEAVARRLAGVPLAAVITSDMQRASDTGRRIAEAAGGAPLEKDARFRELNYGRWEGWTPQRIQQEEPAAFAAWWDDPERVAPPGGETLTQLVERAGPAMEEWVERFPGQNLVLVAHKTSVRALLCWSLRIPVKTLNRFLLQNASVSLVRFDGQRRSVQLVNDTCHLPEDLCSPPL